MRKISLFAGAMVLALGASAVSSSAFAACLNNQDSLTQLSLTENTMVPNAGFGYDKDAYDAALAKGNSCAVTQQSQPVADVQQTAHGKTAARATYND